MTAVWLPRLTGVNGPIENGIVRLLPPARLAALRPFLDQYRHVRDREGYRRPAPEFYRRLPDVDRDDAQRDEWRVRQESFAHLQHALTHAVCRVLDLGAGNGWLAHRLAALGHLVVAVDLLDDEVDGLGVCRHYDHAFAAIQADFEALPFEPGQFDVVVFGGSLHYSPQPAATLADAERMLRAGGALVVMDSPMFVHARDGEAMVAAVRRQFTTTLGMEDPVRPGIGYLTFADTNRTFVELGLRPRFFPSHGPLRWRVRRPLARLRLGRAPAAFGVWIAR